MNGVFARPTTCIAIAGATKEGLSLHSQTVQAVNEEYVSRRWQFKKPRMAWRKSSGARRSLGWIPVKASALRYKGGQVWYCGQPLSLWDSYGLHQYALGTGSFSEDSRGRWYLNVTVKVRTVSKSAATRVIGIDLGLKDFLVTSDGVKADSHRFYRDLAPNSSAAQRANKKQRVKALHAKVANRRKDTLHKLSTTLVREYGAIFVGNVNASGLVQTRGAKSVLDAGWSAFRTMLQYKCADAGVWFDEVNEAFSTQTCSCCARRTGPKGVTGLGIREWQCTVCGTVHDRDVNAARNISSLRGWTGCTSVARRRAGHTASLCLDRGRTWPSSRRNVRPLGRAGRQLTSPGASRTFAARVGRARRPLSS